MIIVELRQWHLDRNAKTVIGEAYNDTRHPAEKDGTTLVFKNFRYFIDYPGAVGNDGPYILVRLNSGVYVLCKEAHRAK